MSEKMSGPRAMTLQLPLRLGSFPMTDDHSSGGQEADANIGPQSRITLETSTRLTIFIVMAMGWGAALQWQVYHMSESLNTLIGEVKERPTRAEIDLQWERFDAVNGEEIEVPKPWHPSRGR